MFAVPKRNGISLTKDMLGKLLEGLGVDKTVDEVFNVSAVMSAGWDDESFSTVCKTDEELNKALDKLDEIQYPNHAEVRIEVKSTGDDIAALFEDLLERKLFMM